MFAVLLMAACAALIRSDMRAAEIKADEVKILDPIGKVEFRQAGATDWQPVGAATT